eukprot:TRINITY_DN22445_c0_g1_i2.p1 TRINITY_DN22445_c0_g1~~TRINITY_DN22445_c0_g1_i2.p1  ORF type:complete len:682 (+),score=56.43 TRINITY_DN22445_c0_g1_i2:72-2117(+)
MACEGQEPPPADPHPTVAAAFRNVGHIYVFNFVNRISVPHHDFTRRPPHRYKRVLLVSATHLILCDTSANVRRAIPLSDITSAVLQQTEVRGKVWMTLIGVAGEPPLLLEHSYDLRNRERGVRKVMEIILQCRWLHGGLEVIVEYIPPETDIFQLTRDMRAVSGADGVRSDQGSEVPPNIPSSRALAELTAVPWGPEAREWAAAHRPAGSSAGSSVAAAPRAAEGASWPPPAALTNHALHAGEWRGEEKRQWCSTLLSPDGVVCRHGPATITVPHWSCCGEQTADGVCIGAASPLRLACHRRPAGTGRAARPRHGSAQSDLAPGDGPDQPVPGILAQGRGNITRGTLYETEVGWSDAGDPWPLGDDISDMPPAPAGRQGRVPGGDKHAGVVRTALPQPVPPAHLGAPPERGPDPLFGAPPHDPPPRRGIRARQFARRPPKRPEKADPGPVSEELSMVSEEFDVHADQPLPGAEELLAGTLAKGTPAALFRTPLTGSGAPGLWALPRDQPGGATEDRLPREVAEASPPPVGPPGGWAEEQARRCAAYRSAYPRPEAPPPPPTEAKKHKRTFEEKVQRYANACIWFLQRDLSLKSHLRTEALSIDQEVPWRPASAPSQGDPLHCLPRRRRHCAVCGDQHRRGAMLRAGLPARDRDCRRGGGNARHARRGAAPGALPQLPLRAP